MFLWAASSPIMKVVGQLISPVELSCIRFISASLMLLPFVYKDRLKLITALKKSPIALLLFGLATIVATLLVVEGINLSTAINGAIFLNLNPLFIALIAAVVLHEHLHWRQHMWLLVGLLGTVITILNGQSLSMVLASQHFKGSLYLLTAALIVAFIITYNKPYIQRYGSLVITFATTVVAAISTIIILWYSQDLAGLLQLPRAAVWGSVALGAGGTALPWVLFGVAILHMKVAQASAFKLLIPVIASVYAVLLLNETLTMWLLCGMLLTGLGVWGVQKGEV